MGVPNYRGAVGGVEYVPGNFNQYVKIYNDTAGTLTNGDVYFLSFLKDADSLSPSARPTLDTPATSAVYRQVVVIADDRGSIADTDWGIAQIRGYCSDVNTDVTSVAIDRFLQGKNAAALAADDGTAYSADSFGITVGAIFNTSHIAAILFGERVTIG